MKLISFLAFSAFAIGVISCKKGETEPQPTVPDGPKLIVKINVNPDQIRLGNTGQPESVASGNAAQNPNFNSISAHYLEFAQSQYTALGDGAIVYKALETTAGGDNAINFSQSKVITPGDVFIQIPLSQIPAGTYNWARLSLSYQNYDVKLYVDDQPYDVTLASFVGYNSYIQDYTIKNSTVTVNGNRKQGYWGFEFPATGTTVTGQAPAGATTVPNPLFSTSPIPAGSCVVTGEYASPLVITGDETSDIVTTMSLSINESFEWVDANSNGKWDYTTATNTTEQVTDMGVRGLIPIIE